MPQRALGPVPDRIASRLRAGAAALLALRGVQVLLEFICGMAISRAFSAHVFGLYAIAMAWVTVLAVPGALGLDRLLTRDVAVRNERADWARLHGLIRGGSIVAVTAATGFAATGLVLASAVHGGEPATLRVVQAAMLLVPVLAFARVRQAALQGLGHVATGQVPDAVLAPLIMLLLVGAWVSFGAMPMTALQVIWLQVLAATGAGLAGAVLLWRRMPDAARRAPAEYDAGSLAGAALPFVWMLAFNVVLTNADTLLVGMILEPTAAGGYRVASSMAMLVGLPVTAVNMALAPLLATLHARGERDAFRNRARAATRIGFALAVCVAIPTALLGRPVLALFAPEFVPAYPALLLLVGGYLLVAASGASGYALIMSGHEFPAVGAFAAAAVVLAAGIWALAPESGTTGAGAAAALALCTVAVLLAAIARRRLGFGVAIWSSWREPAKPPFAGDRR